MGKKYPSVAFLGALHDLFYLITPNSPWCSFRNMPHDEGTGGGNAQDNLGGFVGSSDKIRRRYETLWDMDIHGEVRR